MKKTTGDAPSQLIDARIKELSDWRGETLARGRILLKQADPQVVGGGEWGGGPVGSPAGRIGPGGTCKNVVKVAFAQGAPFGDPSGPSNSTPQGTTQPGSPFH